VGPDGRSVSELYNCGRSRRTTLLRAAVGVMLLSCTAAAAPVPDPKPEAKTKKESPAEILPAIEQLAAAQRSLAAQLAALQQQLNDTQRAITELRDASRDKPGASQAVVDQILDQVDGMRREVWGLYLESSGIKGDIAQTGKQVDGLGESLGDFRLSAGIVVAAVIVLQLVLVGLAFRGRG
jgi:hypothetical protein